MKYKVILAGLVLGYVKSKKEKTPIELLEKVGCTVSKTGTEVLFNGGWIGYLDDLTIEESF